ncbi:PEP-CTERM domain protein [Bradyrhizobium sp. WSM3983]|uniref:PEP-CTERM domain protein n=1 Tax=Bradyrhizobium sp. WSM3983 TaxID=1038867 RepID=UPI00041C1833|nr:PEP-CTERM domain protein [Bradyrhizobium sp. WSM3983]
MKPIYMLAAGAVLAFASTTSADAAIYDFTIHSQNYDVAGEITTSGNQITSIVGQFTGLLNATITGLLDQPNVYFTSDNLFNSTSPFVSNQGLLFGAGGYSINIYSVASGGGYDYYIANSQFLGNYYSDPTSSPLFAPGDLILGGTITAVPEISTWAMLIVGFAGLTVLSRRRFTQQGSRVAA